MYKTTTRFQNSLKHVEKLFESKIKSATDECKNLARELIVYEIYLTELSTIAIHLLRTKKTDDAIKIKLEKIIALGRFEPQGHHILETLRHANEETCRAFMNVAQPEFRKFALQTIAAHKITSEPWMAELAPEVYERLKNLTDNLIRRRGLKDNKAGIKWMSDLGIGFF